MNSIQLVRFVEELETAREGINVRYAYDLQDRAREVFGSLLVNYIAAHDDRLTMRDAVQEEAPRIVSICNHGQAFVAEALSGSGLLDILSSSSLLLEEMRDSNPAYFGDPLMHETLRVSRSAPDVLGSAFYRRSPVSFFSPGQLKTDLDDAYTTVISELQGLPGTNYEKVVVGALKVVGGLLTKVGGVITVATGGGAVIGAGAIIGGTTLILDGAREISDGMSEDGD